MATSPVTPVTGTPGDTPANSITAAQVVGLIAEYRRLRLPARDTSLSLTSSDVVEHVRGLLAHVQVEEDLSVRFSIRTFRFYRTAGLISAPVGQTITARYGVRHILEGATARLAGHLHRMTLDEAAARLQKASTAQIESLFVDLVVREWRSRMPRTLPDTPKGARPLHPHSARESRQDQPARPSATPPAPRAITPSGIPGTDPSGARDEGPARGSASFQVTDAQLVLLPHGLQLMIPQVSSEALTEADREQIISAVRESLVAKAEPPR